MNRDSGVDVGDFFEEGPVDPVTARFNRVADVPPTVMKEIDEIAKGHDNVKSIENLRPEREGFMVELLEPNRQFYIEEHRIGIDGPCSYVVTTDAGEKYEIGYQFQLEQMMDDLWGSQGEKPKRVSPYKEKKGSYEPGEVFNEKMIGPYRVTLESFRFNEEGSRPGKWTYEVIVYQKNMGGGWTGGRVSEKFKDIEPAREVFDQITVPDDVEELLTKKGAVEESFLKHLFKERDDSFLKDVNKEEEESPSESEKPKKSFVQRLFTGGTEDSSSPPGKEAKEKAPSVRLHDFTMADLQVDPVKDSEGKEGMYELVHRCGGNPIHVGYFGSLPDLDKWAQENLDDIIIERQLTKKNQDEGAYHEFLKLLETQGAT